MAKITQYPAKTVPSDNDEFVLHDPSSASTKKMTRGDLIGGAPLPAGSVTTAALANKAVTSEKLATPVAFYAYRNGTQNIGNTLAKVQLNAELYDYGNNFNTSTNEFTAPYKGIYSFSFKVLGQNASMRALIQVVTNNSAFGSNILTDVEGVPRNISASCQVYLNASEKVSMSALFSTSTNVSGVGTYMSGHLVGRV